MQTVPTLIIQPSRGWIKVNFRELWNYRGLLFFLIWRDTKVRYKQTVLGVCWVILQPLLAMAVFSLFFGKWARMPSDGLPYPVFAFCALIPWQLFAHALTEASTSLVTNQQLITKVYFPRLLIPLSAVMGGLLDMAIAFGVLIFIMFFFKIIPSMAILALPFLIIFAAVTSLAVSLWLSALNVQYRDVRYTVPFLTQIWFFLTPVAYPSSLVPPSLRSLFGLNPMTGVVEGFRWALLGAARPPGELLVASILMTTVLLVGGLIYFRRMERTFADII